MPEGDTCGSFRASDFTPDKKKTMKNTQHTPGPWVTGGCGDDGWRMILGPKTRFYHAFGEAYTTGIAHISVSDCEAEDLANARLIAAAPELLAALQELFATASIRATTAESSIAAIDAARAAIAKATGGALNSDLSPQ